MVPNSGDFLTIISEDHSKVLVREEKNIYLLSNICKHRQAIMLKGRGSVHNIVCPIHRWTYKLSGDLIAAPNFSFQGCESLKKYPLYEWNGMLFERGKEIKKHLRKIPFFDQLNFDGYVFTDIKQHECNYNWKTFIEV